MIGLAVGLPPEAAVSPSLSSIEVFTTADHPVMVPESLVGHAIRIYRLDAADSVAAELSRDLPDDPTLAASMARQRLAAGRPQLEPRVREAIAGLQRAAALGIRQSPAVVFDGRAVVYGVTDVTAALDIYRARQGAAR